MRKIVLALCCLLSLVVTAQSFQKAEVIEDLEFLIDQIKTYNPALSRYHPEFDAASTQLIYTVTAEELSLFEYYTLVSKICSMANEGHFVLGDRDDALRQGILSNTYGYLPLQVQIRGGKVLVAANFSDEQNVTKGDEILAINGVPIEDILSELMTVVPSDGNITTYASRKIEDGFASLYHYHIERSDSFEIQVKDENAVEKTVTVAALVRSKQIENLKTFYPKNPAASSDKAAGFYTLQIETDYAFLQLPSFDFRRVNQYKVKANKMYRSIFEQLKDKAVRNLVIDLRSNTGGRNEFADEMVPFIMQRNNNDPFLKKTISWEGKERTYKLPKAHKSAFTGTIYVLVDGKTYSAGGSLARYLKEYGDAIVVGTETGTRYEGFAAGSSQDIYLPNSNIKIGIPRYLILFPESELQTTSNRGLLPDYPVTEVGPSSQSEEDPFLKQVEALIRNQ